MHEHTLVGQADVDLTYLRTTLGWSWPTTSGNHRYICSYELGLCPPVDRFRCCGDPGTRRLPGDQGKEEAGSSRSDAKKGV